MTWPYVFSDLTKDEIHNRRILLDRYGVYAQLSAIAPIVVYQLYRLVVWVLWERRAEVEYSEVPSSPTLKKRRASSAGAFVQRWRAARWWLEGEALPGWGQRGRLIAAGAWTFWLLFLCAHQVKGKDYMHITKAFGEIAVSQFPLHYMLSMKSIASPLAFLFRSSHEELMPWHQILGRIIWLLLLSHGAWYINFFIQKGILLEKLTGSPAVIIGVVAIISMNVLASTSLAAVRRWNYRVFFLIHLILGVTLPPLLFFHASHMRVYLVEALALFLIDIACRKLNTVTGFAVITQVPHTKLVKLQIKLPETKLAKMKAAPGQHVYLSIPPESIPPHKSAPSIHDILYNPFTIADVSGKDITLVIRTLRGPTTNALNALTTLPKAHPPINIEGPYGSIKKFPNLAAYDRILLVGGGVGATYVLPIYRELQDQLQDCGKSPDHVTLVWSMRSAAESAWAVDQETPLENDDNLRIYMTRTASDQHRDEIAPTDGSVELEAIPLVEEPALKLSGRNERPDLKKIVDEVFRFGLEERVAVLVCGPTKMARELREHVGEWVSRGREVFWHDEGFDL
ncbi:hypothetical protein B0O99DRAFT_626442 [Bisporella sp. PMI_857]|nr:hypothetical protein B0O99DRAFT_626442 [Bisporella sp. PMI_857]